MHSKIILIFHQIKDIPNSFYLLKNDSKFNVEKDKKSDKTSTAFLFIYLL